MGACGSKPASNVIAEPPSVFSLDVKSGEKPIFPLVDRAQDSFREGATMKMPAVDLGPEALVERCLQLELENARLREHLQLLAGAQATGQNAPAAAPPTGLLASPLQHSSKMGAEEDGPASPQSERDSIYRDVERHNVSEREAELEAEAADLSSSLRVQIVPEPVEGCTVIRVQAPDRQQLLTDLTRILNGLDLTIRDAHISTEGEEAFDEFWVQELTTDGTNSFGPARDHHAIEMRLRQWSDGRQGVQQLLRRPMRPATHRFAPMRIELPWAHSPLPPHPVLSPNAPTQSPHPMLAIVMAALRTQGFLQVRGSQWHQRHQRECVLTGGVQW